MPTTPHFQKTRIAPTPSGFLHRGNAYSFRLTTALAHHTGAAILLRIDDLDQERVRPAYVEDIFTTLQCLHINWQEGPQSREEFEARFSQRHRLPLYQQALAELREAGALFACRCSRTDVLRMKADGTYPGTCRHKKISLDAPGVSWRLCTDAQIALPVKSLDGTVNEAFLPPGMQHFVVRKKDGAPAYQLTSVLDDLHFGIDLVVRGADLWPSTLAQLYLAAVLQQQEFLSTTFFHHALLTDAQGNKLSKSAGASSVRSQPEPAWQAPDLAWFLSQAAPAPDAGIG